MRLTGYLVASAILAGCAVLAAWKSGVPLDAAIAATGSALGLQAFLAVLLLSRLERGLDAMVPWALGIALRFAALALTWVLTAADVVERATAMAFGLTLAALLILEAFWLAAATAGQGTEDKLRK